MKFQISTVIDSRDIMEENCFGDCFTISDPAHPESYLFGGNSLLYDTDTISTIGFCTETESGKKKVEVYLFTEEQEYYHWTIWQPLKLFRDLERN